MIDHSARLAALELLVEQLVLERCMQTENPQATLEAGMTGLTRLVTERDGVPLDAVDGIALILARVVERLTETVKL